MSTGIDSKKIPVKDDLAFLDNMVIKKDSKWKGIFDLTLMFVSCFNIFANAYYSAFGVPVSF